MTHADPHADRNLTADGDPLRRVCLNYDDTVVFDDGAIAGPAVCRAGVPYADVALDLGALVQALPCTSETAICPRRTWGPRRGEGRGLFGGARAGEGEGEA